MKKIHYMFNKSTFKLTFYYLVFENFNTKTSYETLVKQKFN